MDNVRNIGEIASISRPEERAIVNWLVEYKKNLELVKSQFQQIFAKSITASTIKKVLSKHDVEIERRVKEWHENPEEEDFFHLRERLAQWKELYMLARRDDAILMNLKLSREDYDVKGRPDIKTAAFILRAAAWDKHQAHKLKLEEMKMDRQFPSTEPEEEEQEEEGPITKWA